MILATYFNITEISKAYSTLRDHQTFYKTSVISIVRILEMRRSILVRSLADHRARRLRDNKQITKKKKRRIVSNVAMDAVDLWKEKKKKEKRKRRIISALNLSVRDSKCSRGWKEKSMAIIDESYIFDSMEIHIKNKAAKLILTLNFKIKNFFFFSLHYILLIKKVKHFRGTW